MTEWTKEWPRERGWHWFLGQTDRMMWDRMPEYLPVEVWQDSTGKPTHVGGGLFLYRGEGARGLWTPMVMPTPPADFQIEEVIA